MDTPSPSVREFASRLLVVEAVRPSDPGAHVHEAVRVMEKLRISLTRFAGADGFASLQNRALAMAAAKTPVLHSVQVGANACLAGLDQVVAGPGTTGRDAAVTLIAHLLELLALFIGAPLMVRLVGETWPEALVDG